MLRKIGDDVLIIGGGRWGQITYNNLIGLKLINKLILISKKINLKKNILKNENIEICKYFNLKKFQRYDLIIICKNNDKKIDFLRRISNFKNKVVIEKPIILKRNINFFLNKFKKKKLLLKSAMVF